MPAAQPSRGPSRQALLAEVHALRQRVATLCASCVPPARWCQEICLPKWSRHCPTTPPRVVVRFTSIPEVARTFLDTMRRYEYHVINRAEQV
jgi:hypothetical protein